MLHFIGQNNPVIDVVHIGAGVSSGGAGAAAHNICLSVDRLASAATVNNQLGNSSDRIPASTWIALRIQRSENPVHRSLNLIASRSLRTEAILDADVAHLHWVGDEILSIGQIRELSCRMPIVWTLHDTWAFTGADHHPKDETDIRYQVGYNRQSRLPGDGRIDVDGWVFRRKLRAWTSPIWLVAPSSHVQRMANDSFLASSWPTTVIPNPIDVDVFRPLKEIDRSAAREAFGLPVDGSLFVFGSGSRSTHTKGVDLLTETLEVLRARLPEASFAAFGPVTHELPTWVQQLGYLESREQLRKLYSISDAVIVSSRFETFSQVAAEAQACGTPVAAFATSGLLDVVSHGETGFLAEGFDSLALAEATEKILNAGELMRRSARERAVRLWAMPVVGRQYVNWYERAIREFHDRQQTR